MPRRNPKGVARAGSPSSPGAVIPFIQESDYTVDRSKRLGKGGFGAVFVGLWHAQEIAVKELLNENISEQAKREIEHEAAVMVGLRHPNIVQFLGIGARGYAILMEFMPNRSLYDLLQNGHPIAWDILLQIAKDISSGLSYLHAQNIVHQDLKSLNVLLGRGLRAKLSDFGMAKIKSHSASSRGGQGGGTPGWMAPEVLCGEANASFDSDMYSLGMVFWELAARKIPFAGVNPYALPYQLKAGKREEIPANTPAPFRAIITQCWQPAGQRPKASAIADRLRGIEIAEAASTDRAAALTSVDMPGNTLSPGTSAEQAQRPRPAAIEAEKEQEARLAAERKAKEQKARLAAERQAKKAEERARAAAEVANLLKLVAEGEQEQVEALLQRKSDLALYPGNVTDLSERTFNNITALQYAVWALDWQMWEMIIRYMDRENISAQLSEMEAGSWVRTYGATAEWLIRNLLKELQVYIDNDDKWYEASDSASLQRQWSVKVGTAQRNLPVHVVNEYCHPKEAFDPRPNFKSAARYQPGWRTRDTTDGLRYVDWFTADWPHCELGSECAVLRVQFRTAVLVGRSDRPEWDWSWAGGTAWAFKPRRLSLAAVADRTVANELLATRLQQHAELIDTYKPTAGYRPGK